jgi:cobalt/nickel transport system permease protein
VKLAILLAYILSIALLRYPSQRQILLGATVLGIAALIARLPLRLLLLRSILVVPFVGPFALILYLSGDHARAIAIIEKTYLSTSAVLIAVATTELPKLLAAAKWFRMPGMLVEVAQLIYRYLFVLASQAQQMRVAFSSRCGSVGKRAFLASAGMVAILFGRSYRRAVIIHQAMLARGFEGMLPSDSYSPLRWADYAALLSGFAFAIALHSLAR